MACRCCTTASNRDNAVAATPKFCRHQGHPIDLSDAELACDLAFAALVVGKQCVAGRHALRCRSVGGRRLVDRTDNLGRKRGEAGRRPLAAGKRLGDRSLILVEDRQV